MKILLVGASNPETIRMIAAVKRVMPGLVVSGFLDNDPVKQGTSFHGYPVIGGTDQVARLSADDVFFVNLITGSTSARYTVTREIVRQGGKLANFVHPTVDLSMTSWGVGNYVQESVVVQAGVEVGHNSSIHMGALVGHESLIGHSVFIAHAVSISGCCVVGDGCFIGTNATILPRIRLGKWAVIGAGAVITQDVPDYAVVVGNPGRIIRIGDPVFDSGDVFK